MLKIAIPENCKHGRKLVECEECKRARILPPITVTYSTDDPEVILRLKELLRDEPIFTLEERRSILGNDK